MPRTTEEINAELVLVQDAINKYISGNRTDVLRVGSGDFARYYEFGKVTLQDLLSLRTTLYRELDALLGTAPSFRSATAMMVGRK